MFKRNLFKSLIVVFLIALSKTLLTFGTDRTVIELRCRLTKLIQRIFLNKLNKSSIFCNPEVFFQNPEQRLSQDIDKASSRLSKTFSTLILIPIQIIFWSTYLWTMFGWFPPCCCYLYFIVGALFSYLTARLTIHLVYNQEMLEGKYRQNLSNLLQNWIPIRLLNGMEYETEVDLGNNFLFASSILMPR